MIENEQASEARVAQRLGPYGLKQICVRSFKCPT
jgi:hypothetical protein